MKRIAIDVDDVLAAFTPYSFNHFGKELQKLDYWSVPIMDETLGQGWFNKIAPMEEFWRNIPLLTRPEDIDFEFHCYISSFPPEMYDARAEWLYKNGFPQHPLIVSNDKLASCRNMDIDILIDDKPQMMHLLKGTGVRGIHFITEYAGFEPVGEYVTNMKQIKDLI